jgi:hypothetical protein
MHLLPTACYTVFLDGGSLSLTRMPSCLATPCKRAARLHGVACMRDSVRLLRSVDTLLLKAVLYLGGAHAWKNLSSRTLAPPAVT